MTKEYEAALTKVRAATAVFRLAQIAYRSRLCNDAEFLAAKAEHTAAEREFDRAYSAEVEQDSEEAYQ